MSIIRRLNFSQVGSYPGEHTISMAYYTLINPENAKGFVESNNYIAMEAANFNE